MFLSRICSSNSDIIEKNKNGTIRLYHTIREDDDDKREKILNDIFTNGFKLEKPYPYIPSNKDFGIYLSELLNTMLSYVMLIKIIKK
jgi:hypothetical protein